LDLYIKNRFFDSKDFENPIKDFIQYYYIPMLENFGQAVLMKVRRHQLELRDSWIGFQGKELEYLSYNIGYTY